MVVLSIALPHLYWDAFPDVFQIFQYDFIRNAFLAGTALSIVSGLIGYFVVVRRQAFAGEALSDVAFTGAMGGAVLGINPLAGTIILTILGALAMGSFAPRVAERDLAVGTVLAWVLGLGVLFLTLFTQHVSGSSGFSGVTVLFGSILSVSHSQLIVIAAVAAGIAIVLLFVARPLLFASLDPDVASARGVPVRLLGMVFMVLLAVTVAESLQAIGAMLVFALLLLPAAIAYRLTIRPYAALGLAVVLALASTWFGLVIGFYSGLPSSVCITLLAFVGYVGIVGFMALHHRGTIIPSVDDTSPREDRNDAHEKTP